MRATLWAVGLAMAAARCGADLTAAAGKVEITPTRPVYLAGYGANRVSQGVHDPLWARCLVMKSGPELVALVSCDLLGLTRYHTQKIRGMVLRVPPERLIIGSTHTHSGPDTYGQWGPNLKTSGVDPDWISSLYGKIANLVDDTAGRLRAATVRFASTSDIKDCSYNARVHEILDTELSAMQVQDEDGKTVATLLNYACHPEILNNRLITSDFPHWLRKRVEERLGGVAIYMNGAQGGMVTALIQNEQSYPKGEAWPEAERIGTTLADKALEALSHAEPAKDARITFRRRVFMVPMENPGFKMLIDSGILPKETLTGESVQTEVSRITVGPAELLTLPGEALPNIGLYLKRRMTGSPRFLLGLTGDALGYILTPEDFGLRLYSYEAAVSVGPLMGRLMEENLLALLPPGKSGRRSR